MGTVVQVELISLLLLSSFWRIPLFGRGVNELQHASMPMKHDSIILLSDPIAALVRKL